MEEGVHKKELEEAMEEVNDPIAKPLTIMEPLASANVEISDIK